MSEKRGDDSCDSIPSGLFPELDVSIVKSQYGTVSLGLTRCRLYSKVLVSIEWLVRKPMPSWNCVYFEEQE